MSDSPAGTPRHLWVIGIVSLLWNAMGAFDYLMTQTRNEQYMSQFTQEQLDYFYGFPAWVVSAWAIAVWAGVLGSILLLLRKGLAAPVFLLSFVAMTISTFHTVVLSNGVEMMGGAGPLLFTAAIFLVALGLVFYARKMRDRGVLA